MKYENIKVIVAVSVCIGIFILLFQILVVGSQVMNGEYIITLRGYYLAINYVLLIGHIIAIFGAMFLIVISISYLGHINEIKKEK